MTFYFKSSDVHQLGPGWHSWIVRRPDPAAVAAAEQANREAESAAAAAATAAQAEAQAQAWHPTSQS